MKIVRCCRCHKTFKADKKYKTNARRGKICPRCRKPIITNKGKHTISPYERLGLPTKEELQRTINKGKKNG